MPLLLKCTDHAGEAPAQFSLWQMQLGGTGPDSVIRFDGIELPEEHSPDGNAGEFLRHAAHRASRPDEQDQDCTRGPRGGRICSEDRWIRIDCTFRQGCASAMTPLGAQSTQENAEGICTERYWAT